MYESRVSKREREIDRFSKVQNETQQRALSLSQQFNEPMRKKKQKTNQRIFCYYMLLYPVHCIELFRLTNWL